MKNVKLIKFCPRGKRHLSLNIPFIKRRLVIKKIVTHSLTPVFSSFLEKLKNIGKAYLASFRVQYLSIKLFFSKNFFTADMSKDWSFSSPKMVVIALLDKKLNFFFFVFLLRIWKFLENFICIIFHSRLSFQKVQNRYLIRNLSKVIRKWKFTAS